MLRIEAFKLISLAAVLSVFSMPLQAYEYVEKMNITNVGVSNTSNTFVVYVDREVPGSVCSETKRFKFSLDDEDATDIVVTLATSAFIANKPVQFQYDVGESNCLSKGQSAGFVKLFHD
ncbi:hypothetical protein ACJJIW_13250 [Microbulbifer sp. JMSA004]|uniref:hypothetical protein n=1 Tax=unclassified Microbulbifer TaxID=2619833 RepID=UPI0024AD7057|nr:hypothetical protein [Microbulbifer sp. VAAF005]WHI48018.1 hypothetical protein P0078_06440 [Microbulbifer sp. VAAF005]